MTNEQLMQGAYDALCVVVAGRQGVTEWEQNETLRAALRERLAQPVASGQEPTGLCVDWLSNVIRQADGNNRLGAGALAETIVEAVSGLDQDRPIASRQGPQLLGRVELQREAKHPAPCASHCEAPAFKIEIRQLKTQIEVNRAPPPAQQPLSDAQINSACLSRDHSFGLMDANKRALMICSAREWERAFAKEKP